MIHNEIVSAVLANDRKVIEWGRDVDVKYLFFFKNGGVGAILTKEVLFRNVHICDFDYMHAIMLKDGKPYFGELLYNLFHTEDIDSTIRIYNSNIREIAKCFPSRENYLGYLIYKYMVLNH